MKELLRVALVLALAGCSCEEPPPPSEAPPATPVAPEPTAPVIVLPTATRTDLPAPPAAVEVLVRDDGWTVTNAALVETWPPAEREAVGRTRPIGDAAYPVLERDATSPLALHDAIAAEVAVDRARASITHGAPASTAVAIRAPAEAAYDRVLAVVERAGIAGLDAPTLVLGSADGDRALRLALPHPGDVGPDPRFGAAIAAALGGDPAAPRPTDVRLEATGLVVHRGEVRLAAGCATPAPIDATEPSIARAALDAAAIRACLTAAGIDGPILFAASRSERYGDVVPVLEALAVSNEVRLASELPR